MMFGEHKKGKKRHPRIPIPQVDFMQVKTRDSIVVRARKWHMRPQEIEFLQLGPPKTSLIEGLISSFLSPPLGLSVLETNEWLFSCVRN